MHLKQTNLVINFGFYQQIFITNYLQQMAQRRLWTQFEDNALRYLREECQIQKWSQIALKMIQIFSITDRNQKQCRDRYTNSLNPNLNLNDWNEEDQLQLIQCHKKYGNKWTIIAQKFKGRTDSFIKNHFYSRLRKCIRKLNRFIDQQFKKKYKKLNLNIIFKLTNLVQDKLAKISQDVRQFYENLMYGLVNFSLKAEEGIREYDVNEIQTFILALTSLENLSGTIGANRKPKRGRGHKREQKYLISTDGLCLVLLEDQLILKKQTQIDLRPLISIISSGSQQSSQNQDADLQTIQNQKNKKKVYYSQKTSEKSQKMLMEKVSLKQKNEIQILKNDNDFTTKIQIEQKQNSKVNVRQKNQREAENQDSILNSHQNSSYSDIMEYIMQNSFDYNDNILSLSKQGSLQFDHLF